MSKRIVVHVETRGGEPIASGNIEITSDAVATYATLHLDESISGRAYTDVCGPMSEQIALYSLAAHLEKLAKRIRTKAGGPLPKHDPSCDGTCEHMPNGSLACNIPISEI